MTSTETMLSSTDSELNPDSSNIIPDTTNNPKESTEFTLLENSTVTMSGTSEMVTNALGFTPYNSTNPCGYISGITASMINTALGADALTQNSFATNSDIDGLFS